MCNAYFHLVTLFKLNDVNKIHVVYFTDEKIYINDSYACDNDDNVEW